jgi:hypothetical protein
MRHWIPAIAVVLLAACSRDATAPSPAPVARPPAVTTPAVHAAAGKAPAFVDKVWRVGPSSTLAPGTIYAFLGNGVLVIHSPGGTPMVGQWHQAADQLSMVEDGIAYPTDIVALDAAHLVLRSHNPGGSVLIPLVPAPDVPLPRIVVR